MKAKITPAIGRWSLTQDGIRHPYRCAVSLAIKSSDEDILYPHTSHKGVVRFTNKSTGMRETHILPPRVQKFIDNFDQIERGELTVEDIIPARGISFELNDDTLVKQEPKQQGRTKTSKPPVSESNKTRNVKRPPFDPRYYS